MTLRGAFAKQHHGHPAVAGGEAAGQQGEQGEDDAVAEPGVEAVQRGRFAVASMTCLASSEK
ncbi:hypothetical protein [Streptomyces sp. NRRL F-525]|uniref:hypothetical protein n=1 Tax=Streptomyces sp. NRRL F-525 TaxID=1463861 RepID=UPI000A7F5534|nr:hypothetical protein [Streptomyces sp. NRRL F-525]